MGMVVQHNMQAANANRLLGITTGSQSKSAEKLSSGYRINRAADDAAGLSISEKMRRQIRGLDRASTNAQDGVSSVQTAEGALTEVHDMLQRMNELANQASNGTNSQSDRESIQNEIDQIVTEIDRVSETTKFNETYLLKGNEAGTSSEMKVAAHDAGIAGKLTANGDGKTSTFDVGKLEVGDKIKIAGKEYTIGKTSGKVVSAGVLSTADMNTSVDGYQTSASLSAKELKAGDSVTYNGRTYELVNKVALDDVEFTNGNKFKIGETEYTIQTTTDLEKYQVTANDAKQMIADALAEGDKQVTMGSDTAGESPKVSSFAGKNTVSAGTQIVSSLEDGELSVSGALTAGSTISAENVVNHALGQAKDTSVSFTTGDSVFRAEDNPQLTNAVDKAATSGPVAARTAYNELKDLVANDTITIGTGEDAVKWTVVGSENDADVGAFKDTVENILSRVRDGDVIKMHSAGTDGANIKDDKVYQVIGDIGTDAKETEYLSASDAYKKIATELQKASSIGTDAGKEASVSNLGNGKFTITQGSVEVKDKLSFNLHVGSDADMTNKITVNIDSMSAASLGIKGLDVVGKDESGNNINDGGATATYAIDAIQDAISKVSAQRSTLGAVQNRLEHTINNLDNVVENTQSAESSIRDTDMAKQMVEYSKNNILAQAGQAMLAQANQSTQGVLSILG